MSTHTTVDAQRAADKLRQFVGECSPQGYATITVSVVYMAIRALEQQQEPIPDTEMAAVLPKAVEVSE